MSRASEQFQLPLPVEEATWACRGAVVDLGWEVEEVEPTRIVARRGLWGFSRDPAKIEILISDNGPNVTTIEMNGQVKWQIADRHIRGEMRRLQNAAQVAAHREASARAA